jgi:hypothetical protein
MRVRRHDQQAFGLGCWPLQQCQPCDGPVGLVRSLSLRRCRRLLQASPAFRMRPGIQGLFFFHRTGIRVLSACHAMSLMCCRPVCWQDKAAQLEASEQSGATEQEPNSLDIATVCEHRPPSMEEPVAGRDPLVYAKCYQTRHAPHMADATMSSLSVQRPALLRLPDEVLVVVLRQYGSGFPAPMYQQLRWVYVRSALPVIPPVWKPISLVCQRLHRLVPDIAFERLDFTRTRVDGPGRALQSVPKSFVSPKLALLVKHCILDSNFESAKVHLVRIANNFPNMSSFSLACVPSRRLRDVYGHAAYCTVAYFLHQRLGIWDRLRHLTITVDTTHERLGASFLGSDHLAKLATLTIVAQLGPTKWWRMILRRRAGGSPLQPTDLSLPSKVDLTAVLEMCQSVGLASLETLRLGVEQHAETLHILREQAAHLSTIIIDGMQDTKPLHSLLQLCRSMAHLHTLRFSWLKMEEHWRNADASEDVVKAVCGMKLPANVARWDLFFESSSRARWFQLLNNRFASSADRDAPTRFGSLATLGLWSQCEHQSSLDFPCSCWGAESLELFAVCRQRDVAIRIMRHDPGPLSEL